MKSLVIRHALNSFAHVLIVLDRLDEAAIFVENFLDLCWTWWRWPGSKNIYQLMKTLHEDDAAFS